jgi:hypothetical protein
MVISSQFDALRAEVERSRSILLLENDWDGEGSIGYAENTWLRATRFLECGASALAERCEVDLPVPRIGPGPEGSIDLHWHWPGRELLVNVPPTEDEPITFYGDDGAGVAAIRGEVAKCSSNLWLMEWLTT